VKKCALLLFSGARTDIADEELHGRP